MEKDSLKKYIAEFIGTFALVFFGTGSIIVNQQSEGSVGLVGIALTFGLIITAMIYTFGNISGAHINPAVTIAFYFNKSISKIDSLFYIIAQVTGAIMASIILKSLFPANTTLGVTLPSGSNIQSIIIEIISTYFMMLTILGITSQKLKETIDFSGIVIGSTVIALIFFSGPISGGSFNPARSIGPALISGELTSLWIYLIAPTSGAILATFSWRLFDE